MSMKHNNKKRCTTEKLMYRIKGRLLCAAIAVVMVLTTMSVNNVSVAQAASQNDAVAWAKAQLGKGLDYDGVYGNQCVDLIKYYYAYFGVANYAMGNANAYMSNSLPSGWTRVYGGYQPGDVAVWNTNHSCSTCNTGGLGHVGIITSVNGSKFSAVNQNFNSKAYCTENNFNISSLACAIRPVYTSSVPSRPNVSFADYSQNGVWDTNAEFYVKVMNPGRAHVSALGCYLYNENGGLIKSYSESCSYNTSYVNYNCNFNNDMKYTLTPGTTYRFELYAVVDGYEFKDIIRGFTTTGNSDTTAPVISDASIYDVTETGYKVRCKASDNVGVVRVQFPTWTTYNGQDDIQADWGTNTKATGRLDASGYYIYEVNASDHNGEQGEYRTHIYAYDKAGNKVGYGELPAVIIKKSETNPQNPTPEQPSDSENKADGNALATVAEKEYNTNKGKAYANEYGTSPWCCNFVSWCARQAGISTDVIINTATVQTMYDRIMALGAQIVTSPQRGDLVFYKFSNYDSEKYHHIGIVTSPTETVQGNVDNTWWKGKANGIGNVLEITFVRPAYNGVYVAPGSAYFDSYSLNKVENTNAEVYIKVQNPNREHVTAVGCSIYDIKGNLLKTYYEDCSYTTSYVNYTCNFNTDMGYSLSPGTKYQFRLYSIVGGKRIEDIVRSFTTAGSADSKQNVSVNDTETDTETDMDTDTDNNANNENNNSSNKDNIVDIGNDNQNISLNKVKGVCAYSYFKKITVYWNYTISDRTGYQLQYAKNRSFTKGKKTIGVSKYSSSKRIKKLNKGKYYVRVREVYNNGQKIEYGKWSRVKSVKVR